MGRKFAVLLLLLDLLLLLQIFIIRLFFSLICLLRRTLGYCPQFDALWRTLTVREHLHCYAALRGVPPRDAGRLADQFMAGLRILEHAAKHAKDCSGGTKRKLSYAMSMLGDPGIVLLDEPSTGMDPQSKRFVWDTILASFKVIKKNFQLCMGDNLIPKFI